MTKYTIYLFLFLMAISLNACVESNSTSTQSDNKAAKQSGKAKVVMPKNPLQGEALIAKLSSMLDPEAYTQDQKDRNAMVNYAIDHKLDVQEAEGGILYVVTKMGDGVNYPSKSSQVTAHYNGTLLNGDKFDSSYDRGKPLQFPINRVVVGWQIAIPMLSKGTKATFLIPSSKAYGAMSRPNIPANSPLVFDIELLDFK